MICDLCGREFSKEEGCASCSACGFGSGCQGVRCPYCFYEMVPRPKWIEALFSFFDRKRGKNISSTILKSEADKSVLLSHFPVGISARVSRLTFRDRHQLRKAIAMGVLPGTDIILLQKFPSYIFEIGRSQFSIDRELASSILVNAV